MSQPGEAPHLSIVIPVYNEEGILRGSVLELQEKLRPFGWSYELLLCENGSRADGNVSTDEAIVSQLPQLGRVARADGIVLTQRPT